MSVLAMDADERALARASVRHVLESNPPSEVPGALLAEGWLELVDADPASAITVLGEEAGRTRSSAPVAALAMLWGAGVTADASTSVIVDDIVLAGVGAQRFVCVRDDGITMVDADAVALSPINGFDSTLQLSKTSVDDRRSETIADAATAARAVAAGRRALASEMVGAVEQMLTDTVDYVRERHQYGRAIGSFQSVKHRLADVKVAATAAQAAVRTAWEIADGPDEVTLAMAAKCLAGRAQRLASTHCFQVHGGIAFTVEHGFQQWVRRGLLLDLLLGGHEQLTRELGHRLLEARAVPRLPDLR